MSIDDILVRIGKHWYALDEISEFDYMNCTIPIMVSDRDGDEYEFDYTDIDEFQHTDTDV